METKTIKFNSNTRQIFHLYISIMNPFLKLSKRESQVLSELLFYNFKYSKHEEDDKWKLVFHKDVKTVIQEDLGISVHQFNNILTSLRKKKLIIDNQVKKSLLINPNKGLNINFTINNG